MTDCSSLVPVIGLEVHAQLLTASKMFCGCSAEYVDAAANSHVCPVCIGFPGALPTVNSRAIDMTIAIAGALHCDVAETSTFDRKHYSYPDIPKGYQISQYERPLGQRGYVEYRAEGKLLRCGIVRVHMEEDTGKSLHLPVDGMESTLVDYNRSGVPLVEIVTEPDIPSPEAAREFFAALRQILVYLGVNDGNLQEGSMRADLNVSLRNPDGSLGTKVEIKNLNSFRAVQRALEYEIERQRGIVEAGGEIEQETRGWSEREEVTVGQRSKEFAHDYRYFPEPDLPPLVLTRERVSTVLSSLPELPAARWARLVDQYSLPVAMAGVLVTERTLADYFEASVAFRPGSSVALANWITGELLRLVNETGGSPDEIRVAPEALARLVELVEAGAVSSSGAKTAFDQMFRSGEAADEVVGRLDLAQVSDTAMLEGLVAAVVESNSQLVEAYRRGKTSVLQALIGKVMGASNGKANPVVVRELLEQALREE